MGTVEKIPRLALPSVQRAVLYLRQHTIGATSCQAQWQTGRNFGDKTRRSLKNNCSGCSWAKFIEISSVADPGCLSRIPDPNFFHPESRIRIKEFQYFNPKFVSKLSEI